MFTFETSPGRLRLLPKEPEDSNGFFRLMFFQSPQISDFLTFAKSKPTPKTLMINPFSHVSSKSPVARRIVHIGMDQEVRGSITSKRTSSNSETHTTRKLCYDQVDFD